MNPVHESILACLRRYQVLSLAVCDDGQPWSANAFFVHDEQRQRLIFLSALDTRHGRVLAANPRVAGTISAQFSDIADIHGLQFYGIARELRQPDEFQRALRIYHDRFPQARDMRAPAWEIRLLQLKLTDNRLGFGTKIQWFADAGATPPPARPGATSDTTKTSL